MKTKELKDLRTKDAKELASLVAKKKTELLKLEVKILGGREKNVKLIKNLKKDIVQILTLKSEADKKSK
jgi:ribosomal protein L29